MSEPIIDFDRVEEATGGDHEFMRELVAMFLEDAAERVEELRQALASQDAEELGRCAHKLKGSSANVGAHRMSTLAKDLEDEARQQDCAALESLVVQISDQLTEVGPRFEQYLNQVRA